MNEGHKTQVAFPLPGVLLGESGFIVFLDEISSNIVK
jgi:hypothetical protein